MGRTAPALPQSPTRSPQQGQPGSNGYWRRDVLRTVGTVMWTAQKTGQIKIQAIGAGSGNKGMYCGASAGFGEKTLSVTKGDVLTIVLGQGGAGKALNDSGQANAGGTTSISGGPVGGTPLVLSGATGPDGSGTSVAGSPGTATGPWDLSFIGAANPVNWTNAGSPSSGSPFGAGRTAAQNGSSGGPGWSQASVIENSVRGGGTHTHGNQASPGIGLVSRRNLVNSGYVPIDGPSQPFWDMRDADSVGGEQSQANGQPAGVGGIGAGGGSGSAIAGGASVLGGGTGNSSGWDGIGQSGFGAGGGSGNGASGGGNTFRGNGGNAYVQIFWDEVGA